jgi:hypothetical protein
MTDETPKKVNRSTKARFDDLDDASIPRDFRPGRRPDLEATLAAVKMGRRLMELAEHPRAGADGAERPPDPALSTGVLAGVADVLATQEIISANNETMLANSEKILAKEQKSHDE